MACALPTQDNLLGDLLEVVGGEAAKEEKGAVARGTGDPAESEVTTSLEPFLSLAGDGQ